LEDSEDEAWGEALKDRDNRLSIDSEDEWEIEMRTKIIK
jgi:hypothetical protein